LSSSKYDGSTVTLHRQKADLEVIAFVEFDVERQLSGFADPATKLDIPADCPPVSGHFIVVVWALVNPFL